jgi:hypothetical protein
VQNVSRHLAFAYAGALVVSLILSVAFPRNSPAGATAPTAAQRWPVPLPDWFWVWVRWYLHPAEFADEPFRSSASRPDAAPRRIPEWAWLRLRVLLGRVEAPGPAPELRPAEKAWPVPVPDWFWVWARWYLGHGEFAEAGPKDDDWVLRLRHAWSPRGRGGG